MSSGSFYPKKITYFAAKLSYKNYTTGDAKRSSCKRVVDDVNQMMMINNREKKKRTWRNLGSGSSAASVILNMFGNSNNLIQRVVKAENGILGSSRIRALRWFKGIDHKVDSIGNARKVAVARKSRLVQRISVRNREKKEQKGFELCKKRILMGEKCKPVNASGKLHYGRDGVILAEDQAL
ncbi:hypothetical protein QQ045_033599 [Rhodiola kirilowii]